MIEETPEEHKDKTLWILLPLEKAVNTEHLNTKENRSAPTFHFIVDLQHYKPD